MGKQAVYGSVASRHFHIYSPWVVATIAYGIGSVVASLSAVGLALMGYDDAPPLTPDMVETMMNGGVVPRPSLVLFGVTTGLALLVQAMWLSGRGHHPFVGPLLALFASWVFAVLVVPLALPAGVLLTVAAVIQVLVLAAVIGRTPERRH